MKKLMLVGLSCVFALGFTTGCSESDDAKVARLSEQAKQFVQLTDEQKETFKQELLSLPADKRDQVKYHLNKALTPAALTREQVIELNNRDRGWLPQEKNK